ncbi:MAG: acyl carrier protein [Rhodospirillales bacterium]|jgi:acyl carrier protein|nr:acyl carrier protein [Rhodospirillales bacterium]MBT6218506.1 acyl carrier protein [Rhodospirillaceae bacterium]MBT7485817.1 acyl carrier protein [Rhodospirillales bacterium]MBT8002100.1 acyl carrier protein [Rhodospirillales bacterium]
MKDLVEELKVLLIDVLDLEEIEPNDIENDAPLFNDGLGLDSIDALEIGVAIQKRYKLKIEGTAEENRDRFYSITSLCEFIATNRQS